MWDGLAEQFAAAGHEVIVVARRYPGQPLNELRKGVTYRRMGGASQSRSIYLDIVKDFLYAMTVLPRLPKTDILVTNDFWLPILAGRLRPNRGLIVVSANRFPKGQYRFYDRAARVIAASMAIEEAICQQTPGIAESVRCIPNPFDTGIFVVPATGRADQSEKTILYVGRIHPEKGVDVLIRSFERVRIRHRSVRLRIVGPIAAAEGGGGEDSDAGPGDARRRCRGRADCAFAYVTATPARRSQVGLRRRRVRHRRRRRLGPLVHPSL